VADLFALTITKPTRILTPWISSLDMRMSALRNSSLSKDSQEVAGPSLFPESRSQTPYHQGNISFFTRHSEDRRYRALLRRGFPKKILAVAETEELCDFEISRAEMVRVLLKGGMSTLMECTNSVMLIQTFCGIPINGTKPAN